MAQARTAPESHPADIRRILNPGRRILVPLCTLLRAPRDTRRRSSLHDRRVTRPVLSRRDGHAQGHLQAPARQFLGSHCRRGNLWGAPILLEYRSNLDNNCRPRQRGLGADGCSMEQTTKEGTRRGSGIIESQSRSYERANERYYEVRFLPIQIYAFYFGAN